MRLTCTRRSCRSLLIGGIVGHTNTSSAADRSTEAPAILAVRGFLGSLHLRDVGISSKYLIPSAQAYRLRQGTLIVSRIEEVLRSANEGTGKFGTADGSRSFSEVIDQVEAKVFERIATVWTRYRVFTNGKLHHRGDTVYSLVEHDGEWLIANIADEATKVYP